MNEQKTKVAILINSLAGGGAERVVSVLLDSLRNRFEIHLVLISAKEIAYELPEGQIVHELDSAVKDSKYMNILRLPLNAYKYYNYCKKHGIESSLSFLNRSNYINCLIKKMGWNGKVVISERSFTSVSYQKGLQQQLTSFLIRQLYPYADSIIPISKGVEMDLKASYGLNQHFRTIHNPVNLEKFKGVENENQGLFTFLHVGRLDELKNQMLLLKSFSKLNDLDCRLLILGEGALLPVLQEFVSREGLSDRVKFEGFQTDTVKYFNQANCMVFSSTTEGLGNVLIEALACSLPIISTDCYVGPREILAPDTDILKKITDEIEYAEYGILTPVNNEYWLEQAMRRIYEDGDLRRSYRQKARIRAEDFNAKIISKHFEEELLPGTAKRQAPGIKEEQVIPPFSKPPDEIVPTEFRNVYVFKDPGINIDQETVNSFGEEWAAYHHFDEKEMFDIGKLYFDILVPGAITDDSTVLEVGSGSGRFLWYLSKLFKARIIGLDPSDAVYAASNLIKDNDRITLVKASASNIPFADESFDFVYSIGVLHHIPDTAGAMQDCVKKLKKGGYFLTYIYYDLDQRNIVYRTLYGASNSIRKRISKLPPKPKKAVCDVIAVTVYYPIVTVSRILKALGVNEKFRERIPLNSYENRSFYVMRNDALDRFGTPLEQRFTKLQITKMMEDCGLSEIQFSEEMPYWHAIGKKVR